MGIAAAVGVAVGAITTVSAALTTVAVVGAVVGVVGTITKNPLLQKIGLGLGLVGGIGALAGAALGFGSTAIGAGAAAGEAAAGGAAAAGEAAATGAAGAVGEGAAAGAANLSTELTQGATSFLEGGMGISGGASAIGDAVPDVLGTLSRGVAGSPAIAEATNPATALADIPGPTAANSAIEAASSSAPQAQLSAIGGAGGEAEAGAGAVAASPPAASPATGSVINDAAAAAYPFSPEPVTAAAATTDGPFSGILQFVDKHPGLAIGALQAGGSFLSGATQQKLDPAQVNALNAQAAQNQAAADLVNQQKANLAAPKAVASLSPVTGAPVPLIPPGSGFINQAPRIAVTGAPA